MAAPPSQRFLFGVNEYSRELARHFEFAGFLDDFHPSDHAAGHPVMKLDQAPGDALVVSTLLGRPWTGERLLAEHGLEHLDFFGFYTCCGLAIPPVRFWGRHHADYRAHEDRYRWVRSLLQEHESRDVFDRIMGLRHSGDLRFLQGFTDRQAEQYFEAFVAFSAGQEVFVDVGCYDGATSLEFIRRCPDYKAVYAFEPEPHNADVVRRRLGAHHDVHVVQKGLHAHPGTARISKAGSASALGDSGEAVELVRLVDAVGEPVSYVKMDIEGAELDALAGSEAVISRDRPKLAIAVYHHTWDIWKVPECVLGFNPDYEVRLRHYTEGVVETVMYFLPRSAR